MNGTQLSRGFEHFGCEHRTREPHGDGERPSGLRRETGAEYQSRCDDHADDGQVDRRGAQYFLTNQCLET